MQEAGHEGTCTAAPPHKDSGQPSSRSLGERDVPGVDDIWPSSFGPSARQLALVLGRSQQPAFGDALLALHKAIHNLELFCYFAPGARMEKGIQASESPTMQAASASEAFLPCTNHGKPKGLRPFSYGGPSQVKGGGGNLHSSCYWEVLNGLRSNSTFLLSSPTLETRYSCAVETVVTSTGYNNNDETSFRGVKSLGQ